ncbi:MAG: DUF4954 family protein [Treponema sp.]|nr:DUF4954 family protein [Treponema sp.]
MHPNAETYGYGFIPPELLPPGKDEFWQRNEQQREVRKGREAGAWRKLLPDEISLLKQNGNFCSNWDNFFVTDPFDPSLIRGSNFYGLVRLGTLTHSLLRFHDFCVPAGIRNSTVISCDIGDDVSIQDCAYISHYIISDRCILSRIDEIQTTNHSKFGNGAVMDGEDEDVRVWIDVMNEAGGRPVLPFEDMITSDAFLWAAYRDDTAMTNMLKNITQRCYGGFRGKYGVIGSNSVIKSCAIIKDIRTGSHCYIKGANKLKNVTIHSSENEPAQIGEGVELVNGIVGYGCRVFYGAKAVRFVMGRNCSLKYGARLIHSVLGDNSTVSCCEILNNLIFPMHEQHHNNSFLIAGLVQGMSNVAAAASIGSNHNSRTNDGEIRAGRGFWPGLAVTVKHSSCFASFVLIAKGDYPSELNIPLPFSLLNNNVQKNRLELMPAYYWIHNLYALEKMSWKVVFRDQRKIKVQIIETGYLAPDTADEIIKAISLLENWLAKADTSGEEINFLPCTGLENSKREQVIIKPLRSLAAYRQMLHWYAVKTIAVFFDSISDLSTPDLDFNSLCTLLDKEIPGGWVNFGGQVVPEYRVDRLRKDIAEGKFNNWNEIHQVYAEWHNVYPLEKARHAYAVLKMLLGFRPDCAALIKELNAGIDACREIYSKICETKEKDRNNPFRNATFRNAAEMELVLGNDSFAAAALEQKLRCEELFAKVIAGIQSHCNTSA